MSSAFALLRSEISVELLQSLRLLSILLLAALAGRVALTSDPGARRRWTNLLLGYLLAINAAVVFLQTDDWPFSPYRMMAVDASDHASPRTMIAFRAVDRLGRELRVDPLAWSPLYPQAIMGWFEKVYPRAGPADRRQAARFLLSRAEDARRRRAAGQRVGNEGLLGPLAAPDTNLYWPADPATEPFVGIRIYRFFWRPTELAADPGRFQRKLLFECSRE